MREKKETCLGPEVRQLPDRQIGGEVKVNYTEGKKSKKPQGKG